MKKFKTSSFGGLIVLSAGLLVPSVMLGQGTIITYQGRLTDGTNAPNGTYDMQFYLRDASNGGNAVGTTNRFATVTLTNGLFTVPLNFGSSPFTGANLWLEIGVRTNGSTEVYAALSPRQPLTAAPYAIMAGDAGTLGGQSSSAYVAKAGDTMTGALNLPQGGIKVGATQLVATGSNVGIGTATPAAQLEVSGQNGTQQRRTDTTSGNSLVLQAGTGANMKVTAYNYNAGAVPLYIGVDGAHTILNSAGGNVGIGTTTPGATLSLFNSTTDVILKMEDRRADGNYSRFHCKESFYDYYGESAYIALEHNAGEGSYPHALVFGIQDVGDAGAVEKMRLSRQGYLGIGTASPTSPLHVVDSGFNSPSILGPTFSGAGVLGGSHDSFGIYGISDPSHGVAGVAGFGYTGVYGRGNAEGFYGYNINYGHDIHLATERYAAEMYGDVEIAGNLAKSSGSFKIDHPLDPANKYLYHSFVESPDMKNIYDGTTVLDANGEAVVELPEWFGVLNKDFRYQLTAIGAPGPNLYIAEKVSGNHFKIAGGAGGLEVSWQLTGVRQDAWANAHRIPVEEDKPANERGTYLAPEAYGQPESKSVQWARHAAAKRRMQHAAVRQSNGGVQEQNH